METYFENCTELSVNMIREAIKAKKRKLRLPNILVTVYCGIGVVQYVAKDEITAAVFFTVLIALFWLTPWFRGKWIEKKYAKQFGESKKETVFRFGETIQLIGKEKTVELSYRQIRKVICLTESVVLEIANQGSLFISYDGFTKGTFEEFKQFLREKCPEVTIPE